MRACMRACARARARVCVCVILITTGECLHAQLSSERYWQGPRSQEMGDEGGGGGGGEGGYRDQNDSTFR